MYIHRSPTRNRQSILEKGLLLNRLGVIFLSDDFKFYNNQFNPNVRDYWEVFNIIPEIGSKPNEYIVRNPIDPENIRLISC